MTGNQGGLRSDGVNAGARASFVIIFHPDTRVSIMVAVIVVLATFYGVVRHRKIAPPKGELHSQIAGI